jgi:hypothetical protein
MRNLGAYPAETYPAWSDYRNLHVSSSAGSIHTADITTGSSAPQFARIISNVPTFVSLDSTGASIPTTESASGQGDMCVVSPNQPFTSQVPAGSTGYSLCFLSTPGYASVDFWKK